MGNTPCRLKQTHIAIANSFWSLKTKSGILPFSFNYLVPLPMVFMAFVAYFSNKAALNTLTVVVNAREKQTGDQGDLFFNLSQC